MKAYSSYNLSMVSDLELPELVELSDIPQSPDLTIKAGPVDEKGLDEEHRAGPFLWITPDVLQLHVPDVARFRISDGNSIVYEPEEGIDDDSVRVFMLGSALGALLFQRGYLVLHGNAIRVGDSTIICVGHSGAGKSTLAAAFMKRGYRLLADDVVPIDDQCHAIPGFPRIKLWQDAADKLDIDTTGLRRIRPEMEKFNLPITDQFANETSPVSHVYILNSELEAEFKSTPIRGMERFMPLYHNTYRMRFLENMSMKPEHLKLCGQLASKIKLTRITRPREGFAIDELVDHILDDVAGKFEPAQEA